MPEPLFIYSAPALLIVSEWLIAQAVLFVAIGAICIAAQVRFILLNHYAGYLAVIVLVLLIFVAYPLAARGFVTAGFLAINIVEFLVLPSLLVYQALAQGIIGGMNEGDDK